MISLYWLLVFLKKFKRVFVIWCMYVVSLLQHIYSLLLYRIPNKPTQCSFKNSFCTHSLLFLFFGSLCLYSIWQLKDWMGSEEEREGLTCRQEPQDAASYSSCSQDTVSLHGTLKYSENHFLCSSSPSALLCLVLNSKFEHFINFIDGKQACLHCHDFFFFIMLMLAFGLKDSCAFIQSWHICWWSPICLINKFCTFFKNFSQQIWNDQLRCTVILLSTNS